MIAGSQGHTFCPQYHYIEKLPFKKCEMIISTCELAFLEQHIKMYYQGERIVVTLKKNIISLFLLCSVILSGCTMQNPIEESATVDSKLQQQVTSQEDVVTLANIPAFSGEAYIELNDNKPNFTEKDYTTEPFETYSELDEYERCGMAYANICKEIMPTEKRGEIGMVKPSGWHTVKYDIVDGKYLYNRCHLIGYQLAGENANEKNLITGTRYLNIDGMLGFENMIADYVEETGNHVLYRVTPIYEGKNLVAKGVEMEGYSVEDLGKGISFHVFAYNSQPGVSINYENGESCLAEDISSQKNANKNSQEQSMDTEEQQYVINKNTYKFHLPNCSSAKSTKESNKKVFYGTREEVIENGYSPCDRCKP